MRQLFRLSTLEFKLKLITSILLTLLVFASAISVFAVTWSDFENRLTTYDDFDGIPSVLETKDRKLWMFWTKRTVSSYDLVYITSNNGGYSWSTEIQFTRNSGSNLGVSTYETSDGVIWVVWASDRTGNYEIYYRTSSNLGATWSNETQLTFFSGPDLKPCVREMSDGSIWIIWDSGRGTDYDLYLKKSSDGGISWSDDIPLTDHLDLDKGPSFTQLSNGVIWVVWASDRTGNYDLYYKTSSDYGTTWSSDLQLTSQPKVDSNPFILKTLDGKMWVFWSMREPADSSEATDDLYYMYSSDNGATWSAAVQFTKDPYDDIWPCAIQTRGVKIWVVWVSDRVDQPDWGNYDVYYRLSLVGDVNGNGAVDVLDLTMVSMSYGAFIGDPEYDPASDINSDGIVDMRDLRLVAYNMGTT